jgi:hypothetical protein
MNPPATYTAAHYAAILGVTPRAVRARLAGVPAAGRVAVRGIEADAWLFDQLPASLAQDLMAAWQAAAAATGAQPWRDLAHFLSDPPPPSTRTPAAAPRPVRGAAWKAEDFAPVAAALALLSAERTPGEVAMVWQKVFEAFEAALAAGREERRFKRALIQWLNREAPFLPCSRVTFNRKLREWRANDRKPGALTDGRAEANFARRVKLPTEERDRLIVAALARHAGEVAPAWRELRAGNQLSGAERYLANPSRKSYVPGTIRRDVGPEVQTLLPQQRGPQQARLNGAYITRDWSEVTAGDWFTSDDFTLEIYFWVLDGEGRPTLTRGQWLPLVDCRSKRILEFLLIPEKRYTGMHIRTLINYGGDRVGLPRKGYHFEGGTWKNSKLVGGAVPCGEVELNFAERLGLRTSHALPGNARAKIVENVGNIFQASLRDVPGWVGNNEQVLKLERVQADKRDVEAGRKHPAEAGFLSFDQFIEVLTRKAEAYNAEPQASRIMGGNEVVSMSPDEAWQRFQARDAAGEVVGLVKLPADCRYLLAAHAERYRIGRNGITLRKSFGGGTYRSTDLALLQGREVTVYFDPELPETISIMTEAKQVLTVPRVAAVAAFGAEPEAMAEAMASKAEWNQAQRARLSNLRSTYLPPARANLVDPRMAAMGRAMSAGQAKQAERQRQEQTTEARGRALARNRGLPSPATPEMSRGMADVYAAMEAAESEANES